MSEEEHGIQAYYSSDGAQYLPVLECSCGFSTGREVNWQDAGAGMDEHLSTLGKIKAG